MPDPTELPLLRPKPRRPFDLSDTSSQNSSPSFSPSPLSFDFIGSSTGLNNNSSNGSMHASRSTVALNASTLSGIYPDSLMDEPATPAEISRIGSMANLRDARQKKADVPAYHHKPAKFSFVKLALRLLALFIGGVGYGVVVTHFHHSKKIPQGWQAVVGEHPLYLLVWGFAGVVLGSLLPTLDRLLEKRGFARDVAVADREGGEWVLIVRSIGAFVGIAFAIRKLPWESSLQVSLTLALVNPFLWYLVDRTKTGFWFASAIAISGSTLLFQIAPDIIQLPDTLASKVARDDDRLVWGLFTAETIAALAWIASVMFTSSVTFGNIGRLFAFRGTTVI